MIVILAPSKTLDMSPAPEWVRPRRPQFIDDARQIAATLASKDVHELMRLMHVSQAIATTNHTRLQTWGDVTKPALWAYRGDVYKGMYADQLTQTDAKWAQAHVRIMSGMYGVLTPYDAISPYRLEMKANLSIGAAKNLYVFWGERLARYVDDESDGMIVNLSSDEYARPITKYSSSRIVTPIFMDHKPNGCVGAVPIYSKMMRGVIAHWMIIHRIEAVDQLRAFSDHGYVYDAGRSTDNAPVFVRPAPMTPLVF